MEPERVEFTVRHDSKIVVVNRYCEGVWTGSLDVPPSELSGLVDKLSRVLAKMKAGE